MAPHPVPPLRGPVRMAAEGSASAWLSEPHLGFASIILLLDLPQMPAIFAANVSKAFKKGFTELRNLTSQEVIYPNNRRRHSTTQALQ
ncbi:hypothetical protein cyc_06063 [Cyclospora cayetanensis]|uniref:Uncharacterized protein n=1 Tax=Cyclospora cayetanensis TaxID=88456 RepID=A0A1D3CS86_9EIME|nr:hypothetical protein cyc_06063 [Cyclospora cayetanensis]